MLVCIQHMQSYNFLTHTYINTANEVEKARTTYYMLCSSILHGNSYVHNFSPNVIT